MNNHIEQISFRPATSTDFGGILALQERNLYTHLSEQERLNGFVTTPFNIPQLEALLSEQGVFVAVDGNEIVGYLFAGSWRYFSQWPIFRYMMTRFPIAGFNGGTITVENSFQYGPICIAQKYRGSGVFQNLFECMRKAFSIRYPVGYTFINRMNQRSYVAHTQKLGLQVTDQFEFAERAYYGLAFATTAPQR